MRAILTVVYTAAALASVLAAAVLLRRRAGSTGTWLALMILAAGTWAAFDAIELQLRTAAAKQLASQFQYLGVVTAAPCFLHAAFGLARRPIGRAGLLAVWLVPLLTFVAAWTNAWHGALWRGITIPDPVTNLGVYHYAWWFWLFAFHAYGLLLAGAVVLLGATRRVTRPFRAPLAALLFAVLLPWAGNIAYVFKLGPIPGLNWFSISIVISGCILAWITTEKALLDRLPQAREALIEHMHDAVVVCDEADDVVYANHAAIGLLWPDAATRELPPPLRARAVAEDSSWQTEISLGTDAPRALEVRSDPIHDRWRHVAGRVLVIRDVTERRVLEAEKDGLITELAAAVSTVHQLQAILPVCAGCKKIRHTDNSWSPLDQYLRRSAGVNFTHTICPDCMVRLYGDHLQD